jgi:hypothetical protein
MSAVPLGHGVQCLRERADREPDFLAFVVGFDWLHGNPAEVEVLIRRNARTTLPDELVPAIESMIRSGGPIEKRICPEVRTLVNG